MGGHPTIDIVMDGIPIPIDVEIAELVDLLNQAGFRTEGSCQFVDDVYAEIDFTSSDYAIQFLNVAGGEAGTEIDGLWNRINHSHSDEPEDFPPYQMWSYFSHPLDRAADWLHDGGVWHAERAGPPNFMFSMSVLFPPSDIPDLTELMRQHVAG